MYRLLAFLEPGLPALHLCNASGSVLLSTQISDNFISRSRIPSKSMSSFTAVFQATVWSSLLRAGGGDDLQESYRMLLPLTLTPQNYSRGQDKAACSFCTSLVHPAYGEEGGPSNGFGTLCQDVCILFDMPISALLAPKGVNERSFRSSRGRIGISSVGWCLGQLNALECHRQ
jgi:hypothetical protein